jgi:anti-sigma factor RsiW
MGEFYSRVRFRMDHRWAPDRMSAHLDGELPAPQHGRMERHLGECVECRRVFAGLTVVVEALRRLPALQRADTPAQFAASVGVRLGEPPDGVS